MTEVIPTLWKRILKCGHERDTDLAFMMRVYTKPKIGDNCFCRECMKEVKIVRVEKAK